MSSTTPSTSSSTHSRTRSPKLVFADVLPFEGFEPYAMFSWTFPFRRSFVIRGAKV